MIRSALLQGEHRIYIFFVSSQGNKTGSRILEPSSPPSSLHDFYLSLVFDTFSSVGRSTNEKNVYWPRFCCGERKKKKERIQQQSFSYRFDECNPLASFSFFLFFFQPRVREKEREKEMEGEHVLQMSYYYWKRSARGCKKASIR